MNDNDYWIPTTVSLPSATMTEGLGADGRLADDDEEEHEDLIVKDLFTTADSRTRRAREWAIATVQSLVSRR